MKRDLLQEEFASIAKIEKKGLYSICPRFGKIRTCFKFIEKLDKVLLVYPKLPIKDSWMADAKIVGFDISNFTFTSTSSLHKYDKLKYDWVIIDEIQEVLSDKVLTSYVNICKNNERVIGLSGSLSKKTLDILYNWTKLKVIVNYTTDQGIKDGIITDYRINVRYCKLESNLYKRYIFYTKKLESLKEERKYEQMKFFAINRMRLLHSSNNKLESVKNFIKFNKNKRILLFTHLTKFADSLNIPVYHSKNKNEDILNIFKNGDSNLPHLATLDMISSGITFKNLNEVVICTFNSNEEELYQKINRITSLETNNPEKIANITIFCLKDTQEEVWLKNALNMFNKEKIFYNE